MRRMPITDAFFLLAESRRTPMHVGGLNLFTCPRFVDDTTFLANLSKILRYDGELRRPFTKKLKLGPLGLAGNIFWEKEEIDMDYHIRHWLPACRYREPFALVSRLHSTLLDPIAPAMGNAPDRRPAQPAVCHVSSAHHCAIDVRGPYVRPACTHQRPQQVKDFTLLARGV